MPSEKFRITTNGQSLRNPNNAFFGMTLSANMTIDESDVSAHNDRRSAHNALERQRREHLNVKFQQLAHALPALQTIRRPSKTMVVAKSLEFVSSSLKRENNFLTEIQKLRLENEKLRKQAENSSQILKKQVKDDAEDNKTITEEEEENKKEPKKTLKRKASSSDLEQQHQQQLSPPPTPETMNKPPTKKRMVKQTKSLQSQLHVIKRESPTITTTIQQQNDNVVPWSPLLDNTTQYPVISSPPHYFDPSSYTTTTTTSSSSIASPIHNDLLFLTPMYNNMQHQQQQTISTSQYHNMMNPMLLSPYFVPSTNEADAFNNTSYSTTRDNFYLS